MNRAIGLPLVFLLCSLVTPGIAKPKHLLTQTAVTPITTSDLGSAVAVVVVVGGAIGLLVWWDKYKKKKMAERVAAL